MALLLAFRTLLAPLLDAIVKAYTSESSVSYINQSGATGRIDWWGGGAGSSGRHPGRNMQLEPFPKAINYLKDASDVSDVSARLRGTGETAEAV